MLKIFVRIYVSLCCIVLIVLDWLKVLWYSVSFIPTKYVTDTFQISWHCVTYYSTPLELNSFENLLEGLIYRISLIFYCNDFNWFQFLTTLHIIFLVYLMHTVFWWFWTQSFYLHPTFFNLWWIWKSRAISLKVGPEELQRGQEVKK